MHCITGLLFLLSSCLLWSLSQSTATPNYVYSSCDQRVNYTDGSIYRANLNLLLSTLSFNATNSNGFYNTTIGENPNMVYGLFLCRGDITSEECDQCIKVAGGNVTQFCPNEAVAIIWYDLCMLRYSNQFIFSTLQEYPAFLLWNVNNASNLVLYKQTLGDLMNGLVMRAAFNSTRMYAAGSANITGSSEMIYGLVQCTPDLSQNDCYTCLALAFSFTNGISDKQGGRCIMPSCNLRYESLSFYESSIAAPLPRATLAASPVPSPLATPLSAPPLMNKTVTNGKGKTSSNFVIITVVVAITAAILVSVLFICFYMRRKPKNETDGNRENYGKLMVVSVVITVVRVTILVLAVRAWWPRRRNSRKENEIEKIDVQASLLFDLETLKLATEGFSDSNILGRGGSGTVYKGKLLDGQEIAVKRLSRSSPQTAQEIRIEILVVAKLQHRNLVRLLGYCLEEQEKLLIYEYFPNLSLDNYLFNPAKRMMLDWETRHKIIKGIARGLLYLHQDFRLRIIHRDLKANNVLLDEEMNPKIADFGLAKLFAGDQSQDQTKQIAGTYGYMAPEYAIQGRFSTKSDVYSFGVMVLEIVTGQKNSTFVESNHTTNLLSFVWRHWTNETAIELVDRTIRQPYPSNEVLRCIHLGLLCVQEDPTDRPTMLRVVPMLTCHSISLSIPSRPAFFLCCTTESNELPRNSDANEPEQSTTNSQAHSKNDVTLSELGPR